MRLLATLLVAGAVLVLTTAPATASSSAGLTIRSKGLEIFAYDTEPVAETEDSLGMAELDVEFSRMWDRLAYCFATAITCKRELDVRPQLAARYVGSEASVFFDSRRQELHFYASRGNSALAESLRVLAAGSRSDSIAEIYSVLLTSFPKGSQADSFPVAITVPGDNDTERDSTVVVDVTFENEFAEWRRARLFMLPPELTKDRKVWLMSGIYCVQDDATRAIPGLKRKWGFSGKVVKLRATGAVLQRAFPRETLEDGDE